MKLGVFATFMSPHATPTMIADFGRRIEAVGVESLWMGEHVVLFDKMEFPYPGSKDGRIPPDAVRAMYQALAGFYEPIAKHPIQLEETYTNVYVDVALGQD